MHPSTKVLRLFKSPLTLFAISVLVLLASYRYTNIITIGREITEASKAASVISTGLTEKLNSGDLPASSDLIKYSEISGYEISLINLEGRLVLSTLFPKIDTELDYSFFPDVRSAILGSPSSLQSIDYKQTEKKIFVSTPVYKGEDVLYALRLAKPLRDVTGFAFPFLISALSTTSFLLILFWMYHREMLDEASQPIKILSEEAKKIEQGAIVSKLSTDDEGEAAEIAASLNAITAKFNAKVHALMSHNGKLDAVFSGMKEGVLLINNEEKVVKINEAAISMLGTANTDIEGKSIEEVVRNINLQKYVKSVLNGEAPEEIEMNLHENKEIVVQVYTRKIPESDESRPALMVVLNDVTQLKQLETIRKDFVANVSHELKTPITSIQGFVETLLDGAMHNPEENKKFLEIIHRQTGRLNDIFNDLLILAQLEKESGGRPVELAKCDLKALINSVIQVCHVEAAKKDISFDLSAVNINEIYANSSLLEQALVNLVSNAIKFSASGKKIVIRSEKSGSMVKISVIDSGMGIDQLHLSRIFERFYRVDQGRSREEGGTGLGLSIVRHIAMVHQGNVDVESFPGKGSKFSIMIPEASLNSQ